MTALTAICLLTALTVKHFIFDFIYQPPYQWKNKGTYGHWGGLVHSGQHAIATMIILWALGLVNLISGLLVLGAFEFSIHYHMDWFKMWYGKKKGWGPTTHNEWFILLGFDQLIHSLTYLAIAFIVFV